MQSQASPSTETASKPAAFSTSKGGISCSPPFSHTYIQTKLSINQPNDVYEQEADSVADMVMTMKSPAVQAKPLTVSALQRKCAHCEEESALQRRQANGEEVSAGDNLERYVSGLHSGGQALPEETRSFFEPRFGYDFSNVKVHTDTVAAKSAQSVNALAYTNGSNIVFNQGQYSPGTDSGNRLLAHELTHVVQQGTADHSISRFIQNMDITSRSVTGDQAEELEEGAALGGDPVPGEAEASTLSGALGGNASSMSTNDLAGAAPGWTNNGGFRWWISWNTNGTSGWIVQRIENTYSGTLANGTAITNASVGVTPSYYEAWEVAANGAITGSLGLTGNRDRWERPALGALGSQLNLSMKGTVYWTSTDPATSGFTSGGVSNAGSLLSSVNAPAGLSGALMERNAYGAWVSSGEPMLPACFTS